MKLISEEITNVRFIIEEVNGKKEHFIEGVFMQAEKKNRNGRVYPKDILGKEAGRYNSDNYYVYAYLREDGSPYYIGKGKDKRAYICRGRPVKKPSDLSRIKMLATELDEKSAFSLEREYILKYGRKDIGTGILRNKTNGGEGTSGCSYSKEYKENMSRVMKELFNSGKCVAFWKNKKQSIEHKLKNSLSNSGKNNGMFGKKHSDSTKELIRKKHEKYVYIVEKIKTNETFIIKNLSLFCRDNGLHKNGLGTTLLGIKKNGRKYTQHKGYRIISKEIYQCA
jgi:hypothetical protein